MLEISVILHLYTYRDRTSFEKMGLPQKVATPAFIKSVFEMQTPPHVFAPAPVYSAPKSMGKVLIAMVYYSFGVRVNIL